MSKEQGFKTALWWARRDLRLADNQALSTALAAADRVVPVFVLDPALLNADWAGAKRVGFMLSGLRSLGRDLRARGSYLVVRRGDPQEELTTLLAETGAVAIYAEADAWPYGAQRDAGIVEALPLHLTGGLTVYPSDAVLKADGTPYTVYTPYSRRWKGLPLPTSDLLIPAPEHIPTPPGIASVPIPDTPVLPDTVLFSPGEAEAQRRLNAFCQPDGTSGDGSSPGDELGIYAYGELRDRMDLDATSRLSPYLRFGMLSARQAVVAALEARGRVRNPEARQGAETWLNELIWREFYQQILYHYPHVLEESFRENLRAVAWENDEDAYAAWCAGRTGYPVVDAAMRQLTTTGWMHNRARMIVASFLTKDLLIDWRWGEQFFMEHLLDADHASNNGGWQWTAGTGTDAAPYFRIFSPILQGKRHDPQGDFVRRWVPELARVPQRYVHTPWEMPSDVQQEVGCLIGQDYPAPIVDHAWARERTLAAYRQAG